MIQTNFLNFITIILIFILYKSLNIFNYSINGITSFIDLQSRLNINESFFNLFNFFWTNLTYLYSFSFLCLIILIIILLVSTSCSETLFVLVIFLFYNTELLSFLIINFNAHCLTFNNSSINLLLSNNLNKYHPFIFYISVYLTTKALLFSITINSTKSIFTTSYSIWRLNYIINKMFQSNIFALFLGSWWALQEGTWGGWWNWDASEVLGLLISLNALLSFHSNYMFLKNQQIREKLQFIFLSILIVFFFIQLNFDLVSHNFGSSLFMFFSSNFFFLEAVLIILSILIKLYLKIYSHRALFIGLYYTNVINLKSSFKDIVYLTISLYLIISIILLISFLPLLNYFFWNYIGVNSFNLTINTSLLIVMVSLTLNLVFNNLLHLMKLGLIVIVVIKCNSVVSILLLLSLISLKSSNWVHYAVNSLAILNISSYYLNSSYFMQCLSWDNSFDSNVIRSNLMTSFICSNYFIEKMNIITSFQGEQTSFWNLFYATNITNSNSLGLFLHSSQMSTWVVLPSQWNYSIIINENALLINLINTTIVIYVIIALRYLIVNVLELRLY